MFKKFSIIAISVLLGTVSGNKPLQAMFYPEEWYYQDDQQEEFNANFNALLNEVSGKNIFTNLFIEAGLGVSSNNSLQEKCAQALVGDPVTNQSLKDLAGPLAWRPAVNDIRAFLIGLDNENKRKILTYLCCKVSPQFERLAEEAIDALSTTQLQDFFEKSVGYDYKTLIKTLLNKITQPIEEFCTAHPIESVIIYCGTCAILTVAVYSLLDAPQQSPKDSLDSFLSQFTNTQIAQGFQELFSNNLSLTENCQLTLNNYPQFVEHFTNRILPNCIRRDGSCFAANLLLDFGWSFSTRVCQQVGIDISNGTSMCPTLI